MGLWVLSECAARVGATGPAATLPGCARPRTRPRCAPSSTSTTRGCCRPGDMPARIAALAARGGRAGPAHAGGDHPLHPRQPGAGLPAPRAHGRRAGRSRGRRRARRRRRVAERPALPAHRRRAAALPVLAGPAEAAALGNVLVQARALGADLPDLAAMRALVRRTHDVRRYEPDLRARLGRRRAPGAVGPAIVTGGMMGRMRVALMVTCVNDAMFPDTGRAVVDLLRRLGRRRRLPAGADLLRAADGQHRLPRRGGAGRPHLRRRLRGVRRGRDAVGIVRRVGPAPARDRGPRAPATPGWRRPWPRSSPRGLRAQRVPRRRARGDRRRCLVPAPRDLPPDLPLPADAGRG